MASQQTKASAPLSQRIIWAYMGCILPKTLLEYSADHITIKANLQTCFSVKSETGSLRLLDSSIQFCRTCPLQN